MAPYICPRITEGIYRQTRIAKKSMAAAASARKLVASNKNLLTSLVRAPTKKLASTGGGSNAAGSESPMLSPHAAWS